jgi:hypothetical protein
MQDRSPTNQGRRTVSPKKNPRKPRVLIVAFYWPPAGGPGVQRWLKMSRYLPVYGWEPVILTPENPDVPAMDEGLLKEVDPYMLVERVPIWEPYNLYRRLLGRKLKNKSGKFAYFTSEKAPGLRERFTRWLRGNFFIPDARLFWIRPAARHALTLHAEQHFDAVITSGPPHSLHLIGRKIARKAGVPWMADFRDPWTQVFYWDDLYIGWIASRIHRRLERSVARQADALVVTSRSAGDHFKELRGRDINWIQNGYDPQDFAQASDPTNVPTQDEAFIVLHIGTLGPTQNTPGVWRALAQAVADSPVFAEALEIRLIGPVDHSITEDIENQGLKKFVNQLNYIPHKDVPEALGKANILTLVIPNRRHNRGIIAGKVYEYLAAARPILAIGPEQGDVHHLLKSLDLQGSFTYDDTEGILTMVQSTFDDFLKNKSYPPLDIQHLSRKHLAGQVARLLDSIRHPH